jgi:hypothetical protein
VYINVHAIVLRAERISEKDKRLSLYAREEGRLFASVVGVVRPGARLGAASEMGVESHFRLWIHDESSPYARVTGGGIENFFLETRTRWQSLVSATFLCEWMKRLTPLRHPNPDKYDLLLHALAALPKNEETVRSVFLGRFLELAGYNLEEAIGPALLARWPELLFNLRSFTFGSPESYPWAPPLEKQVVKFVAPLLNRPLASADYGQTLTRYLDKAALS